MVTTNAMFPCKVFTIIGSHHLKLNLKHFVKAALDEIRSNFDTFVHQGSGWTLKSVDTLDMKLTKFKYFSGGNSTKKISVKACIDVVGVPDQECFFYAVAAGLLKAKRNAHRASLYHDIVDTLKCSNVFAPVDLKGIYEFEKKTGISINVFAQTQSIVHPIYHTRFKTKPFHVNLLLKSGHYYTVRNLPALVGAQMKRNRCKTYVCPYCLCYYVNKQKYERHMELCTKGLQKICLPNDKYVFFKAYKRMTEAPFVIYCDIESICLPLEPVKSGKGCIAKGSHVPISVCAYRVCKPNPDYNSEKPFLFTGEKCIEKFFEYLQNQVFEIRSIMSCYTPIKMTKVDEENFKKATHCNFCQLKFDSSVKKCRDHCHLSGKYRRALCDTCNLNRADKFVLPRVYVFAHGLQNYDAHFFLSKCNVLKSKFGVSLLPKTEEKMLSFSFSCFEFKDTYMFLKASLANLVKLLKDKGEENFKNMRKFLPDEQDFQLMLRKGVFPYSYLDSQKKLLDSFLPPKEAFFNDLSEEHISDDEYKFAHSVWDAMGCETFKDYLETYLITDVLLLADVFENFRTKCLEDYELDAAHYVSSAQFTFDAFLRFSKCKLDTFDDVDKYLFVKNAIRGGVSQISKRKAEANNKYLPYYDSSIPSKYILYIDANNLYGYSMCQPLPTGGLRWMEHDELDLAKIMSMPYDGPSGCFVQVSFSYPNHLHNSHSDLPLAPHHISIKYSELSNYSKSIVDNHSLKNSVNKKKLLTSFLPKPYYILHYRLLQFYVLQGLKVEEIHSGLMFNQSRVMKSYVDLNTSKRAEATNNFDSNFFKLLSNSLFGKTIERIDSKLSGKLLSDADKVAKYASRPTFKSAKKINDDLVAIMLSHASLKLDKPSYLGPAILDLAKLKLYEMHYNQIKKFYGRKATLLFTDTDSLMYEIETDDLYNDLTKMGDYFDFSNYPINHPNYSTTNKRVPGFFKDETGGIPIKKFIGLRSKMYCYQTVDEENKSTEEKMAKGVPRHIIQNKLSIKRYENVLHNSGKEADIFSCIRSEKHAVYTKKLVKSTLCAFDDKRYLLDNINSVPYGHCTLKKENEKAYRIQLYEHEATVHKHWPNS
jgi:hypothetical protein